MAAPARSMGLQIDGNFTPFSLVSLPNMIPSKAIITVKEDGDKQVAVISTDDLNRARARKRKVLEEEVFVDSLEKIIKRDFFPDLPELTNQLEWLEAVNSGDHERIRTIALRLSRAGKAKTSEEESENDIVNTNLSLQQFLDRHTSEDNSDFNDILERENEKRHQKAMWQHAHNEETRSQINDPTAPQLWKYQARNHLMYVPSGRELIPLGDSKDTDSKLMPPPSMNPTSTRFSFAYYKKYQQDSATGAPAGPEIVYTSLDNELMEMRKREVAHYSIDGQPAEPRVSGYGFVPPSPSVGDIAGNATPIVTWGEIAGTPLLLDPADLGGPVFKIPDTPARDKLTYDLVNKVTQNHKRTTPRILQAQQGTPSRTPTRTPTLTGSRTPVMSSAARKLATALHGKKAGGDMDWQLRSSYRSPMITASGTPRRTGGAATTPQISAATTPAVRGGSQTPSRQSSSITDGLLNL